MLSAKFDCPVARQNCSRFAIAHDCETEHNQEKSQQTFAHLMISNVSAIFDYHMFSLRDLRFVSRRTDARRGS